ncbi:MAG: TIGR04282 family arsenosugar biosynthesis glycosyltransferase [Solirubrobacterales bacterium]
MSAPRPEDVSLIVIAKAPLPGFAKTRLIPDLGADGASRVAAASLADTLWAVAEAKAARRILVLDGEADGADWLPEADGRPFEVLPQREGGLGERLAGAFADSAAAPALLVGMDTPQITAPLLEDACAQLCADDVDAVLGPASDGGYWAIGFRGPAPSAFAGVPMSADDTVEHQRERLSELGLRVKELEQLRDIDTVDDARAVAAVVPWTRMAAALREAT